MLFIRRAIYGPWFLTLVNGVSLSIREVLGKVILFPRVCVSLLLSLYLRALDRLYSQYPFVWYCFVAPIVVSHLSLADDVVIFVNESFE